MKSKTGSATFEQTMHPALFNESVDAVKRVSAALRDISATPLPRNGQGARSSWREIRTSSRLIGNTKLSSAQSKGASV